VIAASLERCGPGVDLTPAADVHAVDGYDGIVLGGALYMGRWHRDATTFLRRHEQALAGIPVAVFALGPKDMSGEASSRAQLDHALARIDVEPAAIAIFGGVIDPAQLRFPFGRMPASDARDWAAIEGWTAEIAGLFGYGKPASEAREVRTELQQTPR
jgi:menaquinone-dependent protoporphyrinogen oxidase